MLYTVTNPTGIDAPIQEAQILLHNKLNTLWGITLDAYGRAYLLKKETQIIPEVFVDGKDYQDVLGLDSNRLFFVQSSSSKKGNFKWYETTVDIYFILNLSEIYPLITHRVDEEVHRDVKDVINKTDFDITSIEIGLSNVISDFKILDMDNFNISDFEPYHVFKVVCTVKYSLETVKCEV